MPSPDELADTLFDQLSLNGLYPNPSDLRALARDSAKQALLDAAEVFATSEGMEATMFANNNVEAVQATEAWMIARAEQIEKAAS
jgi:hypothetical protein